jgi:hypothetical protein
MSESITNTFAFAGYLTCFLSAAVVLGLGGGKLLDKLDDAIDNAAGRRRLDTQVRRHRSNTSDLA